ncbi:MAG: hypothetical protein Q8O56_10355 [Solirubrobacteraceae bacterium]|nr:hypothetical protein [Solirubrobacteraceae bacterium]
MLEGIPKRIVEIVLEQRSVSDSTIKLQIDDLTSDKAVAAQTAKLQKQGLIAENPLAAGRWHITDAGRSALD